MHMGSMAIISKLKPNNFIHVLINNFVHDSVGGQSTAIDSVNMLKIAKGFKYSHSFAIDNAKDLKKPLKGIKENVYGGPVFIEVLVKPGARKNLGRPQVTPVQNKVNLRNNLKNITALYYNPVNIIETNNWYKRV